MGSGGDVFYMPLPIHELSVPFSRLGGLTRNQNSSISFYVDPFYFKMKMYFQFLDDSSRYSQESFLKKCNAL